MIVKRLPIQNAMLLPVAMVGLAILAGCDRKTDDSTLPGDWQAITLVVQDSIWEVETDPVQLTLRESGSYALRWYNNEEETGLWEHKEPHLIIQSEPAGRRYMTILHLSEDSLVLQGLQEARSVRLGFVRLRSEEQESTVQEDEHADE